MMSAHMHNVTNAEARHGAGYSVLMLICKDGSDIAIHMPIAQAEAMARAFNDNKETKK